MEQKLEPPVERIENNPNANLQNGSTFDEMLDLEKIIKLAPIGTTEFQLASIEDIEERSKYIPIRLDLVNIPQPLLSLNTRTERKKKTQID
jgi:hypothetical protein